MEMVGKTGDRIARSPQAVTHNRGGIWVLCFFCWALRLAPFFRIIPHGLEKHLVLKVDGVLQWRPIFPRGLFGWKALPLHQYLDVRVRASARIQNHQRSNQCALQ